MNLNSYFKFILYFDVLVLWWVVKKLSHVENEHLDIDKSHLKFIEEVKSNMGHKEWTDSMAEVWELDIPRVKKTEGMVWTQFG